MTECTYFFTLSGKLLRLNSQLDYETPKQINCVFRTQEFFSFKLLLVTVQDENDNPPYFTNGVAEIEVEEVGLQIYIDHFVITLVRTCKLKLRFL